MLDLSSIFPKFSAKFGLAVTLIAFLAACSHKKVTEDNAADLNPIPANEVVQSQDTTQDLNAPPTPIPGYEAQAEDSAPAPAKHAKHKKSSAHKSKKVALHKKGKKGVRVASHKQHKKMSHEQLQAAIGSVGQPPAPPMPPPQAPAVVEAPAAPILPMPAISAPELPQAPSRGWMIWALVAFFSVTLVVAYRATHKKKARNLSFN